MNGHEPTNWMPGLIVLGAALLAAVIFLLNARRRHTPVAPPSSAEDLTIRYQGLLMQLKEHAANKHLHSADDWGTEQGRLEQAAAAVLRERDGAKHAALKSEARAQHRAAAQAQATGFFAQNPAIKGALWGAGVVLFFVVIGVVLSRESKERTDGEQITGMKAGGSGGAPMQEPEDTELKSALARVERAPDDLDALTDATRVLIRRQMFEDAMPLVRRATAIDPYHVPTRIHRAVMLAVEGQTMTAMDELQHVAETLPDAYEARLFVAMLALQAEDKQRALTAFEQYAAEAPDSEQPPMLRMGIAQLKQELAQPPK